MPQPLEYASSPESRPANWMVQRYPWWVASCYVMQGFAEIIFHQTEVRGDFSARLGDALGYTSAITAASLFLFGFVKLVSRPIICRWARVWLAWLAAGIYPGFVLFVLDHPIILPTVYR